MKELQLKMEEIFIADSAVVIGKVTIGRDSNIWHHVTLSEQGDTRSEKGELRHLLRYFHLAYVLYASFKCLAADPIRSFPTLRS